MELTYNINGNSAVRTPESILNGTQVKYEGKITSLKDVIEPERFTEYVQEVTTEKTEIMYGGAVENNSTLGSLINGGGTILQMPKWADLTDENGSEVLSQTKDISIDSISTFKEMSTLLIRAKAWGSHDLSAHLSGEDPMRVIGNRVADWWTRDEKRQVLSILEGAFASDDLKDHIYQSNLTNNGTLTAVDGSTSARVIGSINAYSVLNAKDILGDNADLMSMIYMNSATFTKLQCDNLITTTTATGISNSSIAIPTYLGYRVMVDDTLTWGNYFDFEVSFGKDSDVTTKQFTKVFIPKKVTSSEAKAYLDIKYPVSEDNVDTDGATTGSRITSTSVKPSAGFSEGVRVYHTYLLSQGCIQRGVGTPTGFIGTELDRYSLGSRDVLINRQAKVLHPKGMSWTCASCLDVTPTNEELATGANWKLAYNKILDGTGAETAQSVKNKEEALKRVGMVKLLHTL